MIERVNGRFKKGCSGNVTGYKRGTLNQKTQYLQRIKDLAINDYEESYAWLRSAMKEGHSWAFQIYFRDLLPKAQVYPTISVKCDSNMPLGERINMLISAIPMEYTDESLLSTIKVLGNIKTNEELTKLTNQNNMTDMQLLNEIDKVYKFVKGPNKYQR